MSFHSIFAGFCSSACGRWSCSSVRPSETAPPTSLYLFIDRCKVPQSGSETDFHITVLVFYHIAIKCSICFHLIFFPLANFPCWGQFARPGRDFQPCGAAGKWKREGEKGPMEWFSGWSGGQLRTADRTACNVENSDQVNHEPPVTVAVLVLMSFD